MWPAALECSAAALAALPGAGRDLDVLRLEAPSDVPEMTPAGWFWASVALSVRAAALLTLVDLPSQGAATALTVRREALLHAAQAARCAAFVNKVRHVGVSVCRSACVCTPVEAYTSPTLLGRTTGELVLLASGIS